MADKTYLPETIEQQALPIVGDIVIPASSSTESSSSNSNNSTDGQVKEIPIGQQLQRPLPFKDFATELLSSTLNTKSRQILGNFTFGQLGAIQIGNYELNATGDIRITPSGITARNSAGATTFALDGATGDASFLGTISAGALIASDRIYLGADGIYIKDDADKDVIFLGIETT